jgi:hypothetical protein
VLLVAPTGEHLKYVVQMHFPREKATKNTAEYEGLLDGLRIHTSTSISPSNNPSLQALFGLGA